MRKRYLACALAAVSVTPMFVAHQPVAAASLLECANEHTWTLPANTVAPVFGAAETDTWSGTCATVNPSGAPFGAVTVNPTGNATASPIYSGDCVFGFSAAPDNGIRFFIGSVVVGAGDVGTSADASLGVMALPSTTPCTGGTISWTGVENATATQ